MERLSEKLASVIDECINAWSQIEEDTCKAAIKRLAYYEDLEEQGRLKVLPCAVGDMVYKLLWSSSDGKYSALADNRLLKNETGRVSIVEREFTASDYAKIGKTVFLTREEAEQALGGADHE